MSVALVPYTVPLVARICFQRHFVLFDHRVRFYGLLCADDEVLIKQWKTIALACIRSSKDARMVIRIFFYKTK